MLLCSKKFLKLRRGSFENIFALKNLCVYEPRGVVSGGLDGNDWVETVVEVISVVRRNVKVSTTMRLRRHLEISWTMLLLQAMPHKIIPMLARRTLRASKSALRRSLTPTPSGDVHLSLINSVHWMVLTWKHPQRFDWEGV